MLAHPDEGVRAYVVNGSRLQKFGNRSREMLIKLSGNKSGFLDFAKLPDISNFTSLEMTKVKT